MAMDKYFLHGRDVIPEPDLLAWARWFESGEDRIVKQETIGPMEVSTVFLGLDHNYGSEGPPILFETMIFGIPETEKENFYQTRCATYEQAEAMHARAMEWAKSLFSSEVMI